MKVELTHEQLDELTTIYAAARRDRERETRELRSIVTGELRALRNDLARMYRF